MSERDKPVDQVHELVKSSSNLTEQNLRLHNEERSSSRGSDYSSKKELGPVKHVKSPLDVLTSAPTDDNNVELPKPLPPLPPIGSDTNLAEKDSEEIKNGRTSPVDSVTTSTSVGTRKQSVPRIIAFKRETSEENESVMSTNSLYSKKENTEKKNSSIDQQPKEPETLAVTEITMAKKFDGQLITFVSLATQTEWSWTSAVKEVEMLDAKKEAEASRSGSKMSGRQSKAESKPKSSAGTTRTKSRTDLYVDDKKEKGSEDELEDEVVPEPAPVFPNREDEYGIPLLELSDIDSDEDFEKSPKDEKDSKDLLPSIGPPEILKYIKESEQRRDPNVILEEEEDGEYALDSEGRPLGIFAGVCEFCDQTIKAFPTMEQQRLFPPEQLYCCDEYRQFVQFALSNPAEAEKKVEELIDIKPHPPYGSKAARKVAKERAVIRMREREMQRAQAAASGLAPTNFYSFARQMKTINYQLSSQKCLEEGWTVRVPSPLLDEPADPEVFELENVDFSHISASHVTDANGKDIVYTDGIVEKYYNQGRKFLTMFPDGTGCVYYPSGNLAISVTSIKKGQYTYIVQEDMPENPDVLAAFEPTGFASCYYSSQMIRLYLDQYYGVELDVRGARKRRWSWKDEKSHVHAPPFQPICFALNKWISIRLMAQDNIMLTFNTKTRSCRFNVGAKLKLVAPEFIPPRELDEDKLFMEETKARVEALLSRVSNLLKFPNSPKVDKMPPPQHVTVKMNKIEKIRQSNSNQVSKEKPTVVVS